MQDSAACAGTLAVVPITPSTPFLLTSTSSRSPVLPRDRRGDSLVHYGCTHVPAPRLRQRQQHSLAPHVHQACIAACRQAQRCFPSGPGRFTQKKDLCKCGAQITTSGLRGRLAAQPRAPQPPGSHTCPPTSQGCFPSPLADIAREIRLLRWNKAEGQEPGTLSVSAGFTACKESFKRANRLAAPPGYGHTIWQDGLLYHGPLHRAAQSCTSHESVCSGLTEDSRFGKDQCRPQPPPLIGRPPAQAPRCKSLPAGFHNYGI